MNIGDRVECRGTSVRGKNRVALSGPSWSVDRISEDGSRALLTSDDEAGRGAFWVQRNGNDEHVRVIG